MIEYSARNSRAWSMLGASGTLGLAVCELAKEDKNIAVATSDLCFFSGFERFKAQYPERFYNFGIAEQNMICAAAGMTKEGMNVFATTYATFASARVLDQVKVSMGYMGLPVKMIGLTSGFSVGILGATHMSLEDIAVLRSIPNMVILSPADCTETMKVLEAAARMDVPVYIRMSGKMRTPIVYKEEYSFEVGKAVQLRKGDDVALIATGTMVNEALKAAELLEEKGICCEVQDFHTIKPLDEDALKRMCESKKLLVTVEEHSVIGGLGSAVAEKLTFMKKKPQQLSIGVNDYYPHAASYEHLLQECGLTAPQIAQKIEKVYKER
ncbi:transketolase family protein [[Clostridium] hylemonae]|uniref:transketolase family protein n=1 Tax=[Clostridium] hylemonae TaxID=89153 RepID=UPI001FCC1709|nr:transketolase C-terminal domain-containing protein [[Clostridium] hylemonae]BDF04154.1 transketolase [[Clostridium] hylemonae]